MVAQSKSEAHHPNMQIPNIICWCIGTSPNRCIRWLAGKRNVCALAYRWKTAFCHVLHWKRDVTMQLRVSVSRFRIDWAGINNGIERKSVAYFDVIMTLIGNGA